MGCSNIKNPKVSVFEYPKGGQKTLTLYYRSRNNIDFYLLL